MIKGSIFLGIDDRYYFKPEGVEDWFGTTNSEWNHKVLKRLLNPTELDFLTIFSSVDTFEGPCFFDIGVEDA